MCDSVSACRRKSAGSWMKLNKREENVTEHKRDGDKREESYYNTKKATNDQWPEFKKDTLL